RSRKIEKRKHSENCLRQPGVYLHDRLQSEGSRWKITSHFHGTEIDCQRNRETIRGTQEQERIQVRNAQPQEERRGILGKFLHDSDYKQGRRTLTLDFYSARYHGRKASGKRERATHPRTDPEQQGSETILLYHIAQPESAAV